MADYNALFSAPNAGLAFAQGFQNGQAQRQADMAKRAMAALTVDPTNQQAFQALAQAAPDLANQWKQQHLEQVQQQLQLHQENILKGAEIIRAVQPHDQASWNQALQAAMQAGINPTELGVPTEWNDQTAQYAQGLSHIADALKPPPQQPADVQDYEYARRNGYAGSFTDFQQYIHPPQAVTVPYGATVSTPGQNNIPHVTDQSSYDAVPNGGQYMDPEGHVRTKGGQAGSSSPANF